MSVEVSCMLEVGMKIDGEKIVGGVKGNPSPHEVLMMIGALEQMKSQLVLQVTSMSSSENDGDGV